MRAIIVGKGPGRGLAPMNKEEGCHIWGINNVYLEQYVDMIFDMHDIEWTEEEIDAHYDHIKHMFPKEEIDLRIKLKQEAFKGIREHCVRTGMPYMSLRKYDGIPSSIGYPLKKIVDEFDCDYFPSTVTYAIAYAIWKGYDSVECYGIGCAAHEEWAYQRAAVSHWLGIAKGRGMDIAVTGEWGRPLRILSGKLYGYGTPQMERGIKCMDGYVDHASKKVWQAEVWKEDVV